MRKTYQMFLALAMMMLGAMNVSAEEISLEEVPFWAHEAGLWGLDAPKNTPATPAWVIGESTGQPYGDSSVNAWADLSGFDQLVITYTEGKPRVMMNRDQDEGQYNTTEAESHLIEYPKCASSWAGKYFTDQDGVVTVDLKQIVNEKGFAHLHAIKGADWQNTTITSMVLIRKGKEKQVGWVNLINNSNMEGDDVSSFFTKVAKGSPEPSVITDGVGFDGTRGIVVAATAKESDAWDNQFWFRFNETVPEGTKYRVSFNYRADAEATVSTQAHAEPSDYIHYEMLGNLTFLTDWETFSTEGEVTAAQAGPNGTGGLFTSIAFNLNEMAEANNYYFDNIKFEVWKYGTTAEFKSDFIQIDFGFETNIPELCKAAGAKRIMFPNENAKVLVNGQEVTFTSIEGYEDGRFYIFLDEGFSDTDEIHVTYNNAAGAMQLKYAGGPNAGQAIPNVDEIADYNDYLDDGYDDIYPYMMLAPTIVAAYPEQGSFNIKNDLKEFKVKFDKKADAAQIVAKLDGKALTISPADGFVEEITMTYTGADLSDGLHTINVSKIYPEMILDESIYTDTTYVFSVGAPDPNDVAIELIPLSYFTSCAMNSVPEGFKLYADNMEERIAGGNYGSGGRFFNDFAAGGDFTGALYMRSNYLTYGFNDDEHKLTMEAGKKYTLTFNTARWKASGEYLKVLILDAAGEEKFSQTVTCNPDVNGAKTAVKNSSAYTIEFTPETAGDYELRFVVANNADGEDAGETWHELLLANVKFGYIPSSFGIVETIAVAEALEKAKTTQADDADERYDGPAQTALNEAIAKVEAEKDNYTSPSECNGAVELLDNCRTALIDHVDLCNSYDQLIKDGSDVVRQNENPSNTGVPTKFVSLSMFAELKALVDKYHGVSEMLNDGTEEEPNWQKHYTFDVLKDDAQLKDAVAELTDIVNTTSKLFTTGASQRNTTGVAALVERLRLGGETLKALGHAENSYPVAQAFNALDDDDDLAEEVKKYIKADVYGKLKDGENIFEKLDNSDPENPEMKAVTIDMSVFVKNPNLYAREYTTEVPGWTTVSGNPQAWSSWDGNVSHNSKTPYVEDCCIYLQWHSSACVEQTITDLPAGVYTIQFNANDNSGESDGTYVYVKTSETPAVEEGAEFSVDVNTAGYAQVDNSGWDRVVENIVVTDGVLTLGFRSGTVSQPFLEWVHVLMTSAAGVDYNALYNEVAAGIETLDAPAAAKVRAIQIFDLNGRRLTKAQKGITIVKKVMSDGSIKTDKVIVK